MPAAAAPSVWTPVLPPPPCEPFTLALKEQAPASSATKLARTIPDTNDDEGMGYLPPNQTTLRPIHDTRLHENGPPDRPPLPAEPSRFGRFTPMQRVDTSR